MSPGLLLLLQTMNDAATLYSAAQPLMQQYLDSGKEPTVEEVQAIRKASAERRDGAIQSLEDHLK